MSKQELKKHERKEKIKEIYEESKQNYGAPKITKELNKEGDNVAIRTISTYMKELGLKAQWVTPWIHSGKEKNIL